MTQEQIRLQNIQLNRNSWYSEYAGKQCVGCVIYWVYVFNGLTMAEDVTFDNKTVYHYGTACLTYEWIKDPQDETKFMPKFQRIETGSDLIDHRTNEIILNQNIFLSFLVMKTYSFKIRHQGGPLVNDNNIACVVAEGDNFVAFEIDMQTKRAIVLGSGCDEDEQPSLHLGIDENSVHFSEGERDQDTEILFKNYPNYRVFAAEINRYTLKVCLFKEIR
jgi:hypothetical protein